MKAARLPLATAFAMIEVLAVIAALAAIAGMGYVAVSNARSNADDSKLSADVASINRSVQIYLSNGGSLAGVTTIDGLLTKLKTKGDSTRILGVTGSMLDPRTVADYGDSSQRLRARWLPSPENRLVVESGTSGAVRFTFDESLAANAATVESGRTTSKDLASNSSWVWDFQNTAPAAPAAGNTPQTSSSAASALGGAVIAQLSAPTFSPGGGTTALAGFPRTVTITNPNAAGTSQIYYSTGGAYTLYSAPISMSPGPVSAVAVTLDPSRYTTSPTQSATYLAQINLTWTATGSLTYDQITDATPDTASVAADGSGPFTIRYTTNGTTPTAASAAYASALTLTPGMWTSSTLSLQAVAISSSAYYVSSGVATSQVMASPTALSVPSISPGSRIVFGSTFVTIAKDGASPTGTRLFYTTNGSTPTVSSTPYSSTFYVSPPEMNATKTVQAIAAGPTGQDFWFTPSGVASVSYTGLNFDYYNLDGVLIGGGTINNNASLNGSVVLVSTGSTQPNVVFNNNSELTGDIYAPGTPTVVGVPASRVINLDGATTPTNYTITMDKADFTGKVYRRITPVTMPVVTLPSGLVERGSATAGTLQPGHYTSLNGSNGGTFTLGVAGATTPSVYVIDSLSVGNNARINIVGPVTLVLNPGFNNTVDISNNAIIGNSAHPEWLNIRMYTGNIRVGNNGFLYGSILNPNGAVIFDNNSTFIGGVTAKYLTISNNGAGLVFSLPPPSE